MASKIVSVAVIANPQPWGYTVGDTHNGHTIDLIRDDSLQYPNSLETIITGYTYSGEIVFQIINAPVCVNYKYQEDYCYVGYCPVCGLSVEESEAGYCETCGQAFHWSRCGNWHKNEHTCNNCMEEDKG